MASVKTGPLAAFCGLAVATAVSFAIVPASAEDAPADKVVATINGTPITEGDLGIAEQEFGEQLQRIPKQHVEVTVTHHVIAERPQIHE